MWNSTDPELERGCFRDESDDLFCNPPIVSATAVPPGIGPRKLKSEIIPIDCAGVSAREATIETTVSDVAAILDGRCDRRNERELFMIGSLDELGEESGGG